MTRTALLAFALGALAPEAAPAQAARQPDLSREIIGVWEGAYESQEVPPGGLKLTVARGAQGAWQATLEIYSDEPPPTGELRDFKVEGDKVSWAQTVAEFECLSSLTFEGGVLKGGAECWANGAVAVRAAFTLEKKRQ